MRTVHPIFNRRYYICGAELRHSIISMIANTRLFSHEHLPMSSLRNGISTWAASRSSKVATSLLLLALGIYKRWYLSYISERSGIRVTAYYRKFRFILQSGLKTQWGGVLKRFWVAVILVWTPFTLFWIFLCCTMCRSFGVESPTEKLKTYARKLLRPMSPRAHKACRTWPSSNGISYLFYMLIKGTEEKFFL